MTFYRCSKPFCVPMYDNDGRIMENRSFFVKKNSVWERTDEQNMLGGEVHLQDKVTGEWLEITSERLRECFNPKDE